MTDTKDSTTLLTAAINAAASLKAVYELVDRVNAAGGATNMSGVAACHSMISSLNKNRARFEDLVLKPLVAEIEARK